MRPIPKAQPDVVTETTIPTCAHCECNDLFGGRRWCGGCGHDTCTFAGRGGRLVRICNERDCGGTHYGLGLCRTHYMRVLRFRRRQERRAA